MTGRADDQPPGRRGVRWLLRFTLLYLEGAGYQVIACSLIFVLYVLRIDWLRARWPESWILGIFLLLVICLLLSALYSVLWLWGVPGEVAAQEAEKRD
jgi:hypothetical protein